MIQRGVEKRLIAALSDTPVVALMGPRRAGKSTLATAVAEGRTDIGRFSYVTFDDALEREAAMADAQAYIEGLNAPAVIDEAQLVPEVFRAVKLAVDRDPQPGRFLLTGSVNAMFRPEIASALAGRAEVLTLWPLAAAELAEGRGDFVSALFDPSSKPPAESGQPRDLIEACLAGGYPEALGREGARRRAWLGNYLGMVIDREVRTISELSHLAELPRVLAATAARTRGPMNLSSISQDLGISRTTLDRYALILEQIYLTQRILAWHRSSGPRLVKSAKVLLGDSGLLCRLLNLDQERLHEDRSLQGVVIENYIGMELVKLAGFAPTQVNVHHYRTSAGVEIDFLLEDDQGRVAGVEVKAHGTARANDFKRFQKLQEQLGDRFVRGVVLHNAERGAAFGERLEAWPISALWQ